MRYDTFALLRRAGQLKRLHTVETVGAHTLARHVYGSMLIAERLLEYDSASYDRARVLRALLFHDAAEVETGDTPAPVKRDSPMLGATLAKLEATFDHEHCLGTPLSEHERLFVKACDTLDLAWACIEEARLGNRNDALMLVFENCMAYIKEQFTVLGVAELAREAALVWEHVHGRE